MANLGLGLVRSLLDEAKVGDTDKGMLYGYFEKHSGNFNGERFAARVLETVLTSLESNPAVTDLHRDVLQNLIHLLQAKDCDGRKEQLSQANIRGEPSKKTSTSDSCHDGTTCSIYGSSPENLTVRTQEEHSLNIPDSKNGNTFNRNDPSPAAPDRAQPVFNGATAIATNVPVKPLGDNASVRSIRHMKSEDSDRTSLVRLELVRVPAKRIPGPSDGRYDPLTTILTNDPELLPQTKAYSGSSQKKLPHEWQGPIPPEELQSAEMARNGLYVNEDIQAQFNKNDVVEGFAKQLNRNSTEALWVSEPPHANQAKTNSHNHRGSYQPENPGYSSRRGGGQSRGGHRGNGNSAGEKKSTQNETGNQSRNQNRSVSRSKGSRGSRGIHTPPRRRLRKDNESISVFDWGPGSEEKKTSFRSWEDAANSRASPTPSESVSHLFVEWTSDIAENLRNHPPKNKAEVW
ncbi:hypothetical protein F5Y11DRAFT_367996 [Daldinia sp. FL1419]|nr:hypothetical protein F5Y11DRAFT_367996 [Daldinia sp. FL1419]